jgi:hypothetical protein
MTYEAFYAGVGGIVLGTLLGSWLTARLTYGFQQRLLQQQLEFQQRLLEQQLAFQKQQADADAAQRKQLHAEVLATFTEFRNMLNTRAGQVVSRMPQ